MGYTNNLSKPGDYDKEIVERMAAEVIMDAAIDKAIKEKREILRPSIEHFLQGNNVNGEFRIALQSLCRWFEKKAIEAINERLNQEKETGEPKIDKITIAKEFLQYAKGSDFLYDFLVAKGYDHDLY